MEIDIKKILKKNPLHKFSGIAPEGFVLIHELTLVNLKNYDTWKKWVDGNVTISSLNSSNLNIDNWNIEDNI